jgi:hypothetical protein
MDFTTKRQRRVYKPKTSELQTLRIQLTSEHDKACMKLASGYFISASMGKLTKIDQYKVFDQ